MANGAQKVHPGDLILAANWNLLVDKCAELERRLTALERHAAITGAVVITDLIPSTGEVRVGEELQVLGRNFEFSTGSLRVFIDDVRVDAFDQFRSNDQRLVFSIPLTITDVPAGGRSAGMTVSNSTSSAHRTLSLDPALILGGAVNVIPQGVKPGESLTPQPNQPFILRYLLHSRATLDATFAVVPTISVVQNQSIWQAAVELLDDREQVNTSGQIRLAPEQQKTFFVQINPIPPGTSRVPFSVEVTATAGTLSGASGDQNYTVGTAAEQPDTTITLGTLTGEIVPAGSAGSVQPTTIQLASRTGAKLSLTATFRVPGTYDARLVFPAGTSNWDGLFESPAPPDSSQPLVTVLSVTGPELESSGSADKTLRFTVFPKAGASAAGKLSLQLQRQGASKRVKTEYDLVLM